MSPGPGEPGYHTPRPSAAWVRYAALCWDWVALVTWDLLASQAPGLAAPVRNPPGAQRGRWTCVRKVATAGHEGAQNPYLHMILSMHVRGDRVPHEEKPSRDLPSSLFFNVLPCGRSGGAGRGTGG